MLQNQNQKYFIHHRYMQVIFYLLIKKCDINVDETLDESSLLTFINAPTINEYIVLALYFLCLF